MYNFLLGIYMIASHYALCRIVNKSVRVENSRPPTDDQHTRLSYWDPSTVDFTFYQCCRFIQLFVNAIVLIIIILGNGGAKRIHSILSRLIRFVIAISSENAGPIFMKLFNLCSLLSEDYID